MLGKKQNYDPTKIALLCNNHQNLNHLGLRILSTSEWWKSLAICTGVFPSYRIMFNIGIVIYMYHMLHFGCSMNTWGTEYTLLVIFKHWLNFLCPTHFIIA